jgi:multimeric flavodoxin WrbA
MTTQDLDGSNMSNKKVVILNGTGNGDDCFDSPFSVLMDILNHNNADVSVYRLKDLTLAHCTGCFGCWVKTPGTCVASDEGRKIIQSVIQSDMTILYSPVTFGGYSSVLKIIVDRFIPLVLPFFGHFHGETHHTRRYSR